MTDSYDWLPTAIKGDSPTSGRDHLIYYGSDAGLMSAKWKTMKVRVPLRRESRVRGSGGTTSTSVVTRSSGRGSAGSSDDDRTGNPRTEES